MRHIDKESDGVATLSAGRFLRIGKALSCAFIASALVIVVFFHSCTWFRGMRENVLAEGPLLLLLGLLAGLLLFLANKSKRMNSLMRKLEPRFTTLVWGFGIVLFLVQLGVAKGSWFLTDWDAGALVHGAVYGIQDNFAYFSTYPNQLFLTSLFEVVAHIMPNATYESVYFALVAGSCLCLSFSVVATTLIARKLSSTKTALLALALSTALFGLSPWMLVPYSDTYGMVAPMASFLVFVYVRQRPLRLAGVTFFSMLGYFVKPTTIFVLCAILLAEACSLLRERPEAASREAVTTFAKKATAAVLAIVCASFTSLAINAVLTSHYNIDKSCSLSLEHYLMLGANYESNGRWTAEDFELSASIEDPAIRKQKDVEEWLQRIDDMGVSGVAKLAVKKTLNNYLDGAFWWEGEGKFYADVKGDNEAIRDFYNIGHEKNWIAGSSENATLFFIIEQGVWFFVLIGCCLGALNRKSCSGIAIAYLVILAVSLFLTVFECRARYLFLFAPFFTLLGATGWQAAIHWVNNQKCMKRRQAITIDRGNLAGVDKAQKMAIGHQLSSSNYLNLQKAKTEASIGVVKASWAKKIDFFFVNILP